ncbi:MULTISPECIES: DUF6625 family protein [Erysipelotrichales]|uniref:DUF6625 family protein n=1 Tax=Erysipelotrichales TaxID=526525 RepID=UPI0018AC2E15|nr:DUF6625 family protein [Catenibacterium mitsuokai]
MNINICVIGIYFGKLPQYFNLWLKSAEKNSQIDFLIFTDCHYKKLPKNVRFINMRLSDVKKRADNVIGFEIELSKPYKCCDYRPCFGLMFKDYLQDYDYWGHCDFDMIFGDIMSYLKKFKIQKYDKFLSQGHLAFYRNTPENNNRFWMDGAVCGTQKEVFTLPKAFAFDETSGIGSIFKKNKYSYFDKRIFADITPIHNRFTLTGNDKNYDDQVFYWKDGKVYRSYVENSELKIEEFIYIHFQKRGNLEVHNYNEINQCFFVTKSGFYPMNSEYATMMDIQKYNPYKSNIIEKYEEFIYQCKIWIFRFKRKIRLVQ